MTTTEAAEFLGVTQSRIRQLVLAGKLKAEKVGRDWSIREKDLKNFTPQPRGPRRSKNEKTA